MNLTSSALLMLCGLAAPTFGAVRHQRPWLDIALAVLGFAASTVWLEPGRLPDAAQAAALVALVAALQLFLPRTAGFVTSAPAGAVAGVWTLMLQVQGVPLPAAVVLGTSPLFLSWYLTATRPRFAPPVVQEEALLIVLALGIAVALAPGILDGWQSAVVLNIQNSAESGLMLPVWTLGLIGGSAALGGLYSAWRRG